MPSEEPMQYYGVIVLQVVRYVRNDTELDPKALNKLLNLQNYSCGYGVVWELSAFWATIILRRTQAELWKTSTHQAVKQRQHSHDGHQWCNLHHTS